MNLKAILLGLLLGAWMLGSWWYYKCKICDCCSGATTALAIEDQRPLLFKWSDANTITNAKFAAYKDSITSLAGVGDTLLITGYYFKDEPNTSSFADMGIARAEKAKALFTDKFGNRIKTTSQMVDERDGVRNNLFESAGFSFIPQVLSNDKATIIESDTVVYIYFPFNSAQQYTDPTVQNYLKTLAQKHRSDNVLFDVSGHADSIGAEQANYNLGLRRAKIVRDALVRQGVKQSRISVSSGGETKPIDTNNTDDGRQRNRRTEIKINAN